MADRPERTDVERGTMLPLQAWMHASRLTKEQLEAAERTRAYHLRKLQAELHPEEVAETARGGA